MKPDNKTNEHKEIIISMKSAFKNMEKTLARIESLEYGLKRAADQLKEASELVHGYTYQSNKSYRSLFQEYEIQARNRLSGES